MTLREWWDAVHFLRPHWLWMIFAVPVFYLSLAIRDNARARWQRYIDADLLDHLIVKRRRRWRFRPVHLLSLLILIGSIAVAGPAWLREQPPFTEDKAPLVIALDLSPTMNAIDLNPTRLERVKLKLRDLIGKRNGGRTALFVYAGTTHMVLPFTTDTSLFDVYLDSLSTSLMPRTGKDTARALDAIESFLTDETVPGTVLFVTDGIEPAAMPALQKFTARQDQPDDILVLGVGTSVGGPVRLGSNRFLEENGRRVFTKLDVSAMRDLSKYRIDATTLTLDDDDIRWIQRRVQHHLQAIQQKDAKTRWIDEGYWLTIPVAALGIFWFNKGWTIRWTSTALAVAFVLPPQIGPTYAVGLPSILASFSWLDLWMTPDQQGRYYFQKGDYKKAAEEFEDPLWRGLASARAGDNAAALNAFALSDTAEAWYNQGNSLARMGKYPEAVTAYRQSLARRPNWNDAEANLTLVQSLIPKPTAHKKDKQEPQEEALDLPPDQTKFDDKGKQGKTTRMNVKPETVADIWMRNIQTTPADFLRRRFAIQDAKAGHR
ncbi:VWA domain-containing protein [Edaphobacter sp. HDX4]|uniref:VWA domain-containing protein n=1 Tax=Edaphobacter sp. HDX4 TaxID=2794064 RepID=UPI002FE66FCF